MAMAIYVRSVLVTHLCSELSLRDAVGDMQTKGCFIGDAQVLRIEKPE